MIFVAVNRSRWSFFCQLCSILMNIVVADLLDEFITTIAMEKSDQRQKEIESHSFDDIPVASDLPLLSYPLPPPLPTLLFPILLEEHTHLCPHQCSRPSPSSPPLSTPAPPLLPHTSPLLLPHTSACHRLKSSSCLCVLQIWEPHLASPRVPPPPPAHAREPCMGSNHTFSHSPTFLARKESRS